MTDIVIDKIGHVTVLTLNRPEKMNAVTPAMIDDLIAAMADFDADPDQYVAVVTGAGNRAFSSGFDLEAMAERASGNRMSVGVDSVDLWGVGSSQKPTIAAVNGLAVAGGFELTLSCDIRVASTNAWFGLFEVKRGILAGVGVNLLSRYLPHGEAMYLLLTGETMSVEDAHRLGLVQRVVEPDVVVDTAVEIAERIAANSQVAVQASKQVANFWRNHAVREQLDLYRAINQRVMLADDAFEGVRAFVEKRSPEFSNTWPERPATP